MDRCHGPQEGRKVGSQVSLPMGLDLGLHRWRVQPSPHILRRTPPPWFLLKFMYDLEQTKPYSLTIKEVTWGSPQVQCVHKRCLDPLPLLQMTPAFS
jgi:hypothetical protein